MGAFGSVIPVTGLNKGFRGQVSRTGGGDPFIVSKQANPDNNIAIEFGDPVVVLPDSAGGTYRQFGDFIANGGETEITTVTLASNTTATPASLNGLVPGMFLFGTDIPAGTFIVSINQSAGTFIMSQAATGSPSAENLYVAVFGGLAVREVKSQLGYPYTPGSSEIGTYLAGQLMGALVRGSISAQIYNGTPIQNGSVYLRAATNSSYPAGVVGQLEAQADGVKNILLPNVTFKTGAIDGNDICEVTLLDRVAA